MSTDMERELERTTQQRGFRFGLHDFVAQVYGLEALKKHNDNSAANYLKKSLLDRKTKELLIIVACVGQKDLVSHIQLHMHAAHRAGASLEEIMAAVQLTGRWAGSVAKLGGLEAWRATFRPDLPNIDGVVELLFGAEALKNHKESSEGGYFKDGILDRKTQELMIMVACMGQRDLVSRIQLHIQAAHKAGATPGETMAALQHAGKWLGSVTELVGLEAWRATFRPDLPSIDRVVELR